MKRCMSAAGAFLLAFTVMTPGSAQDAQFTPGKRVLFSIDFAAEPLGEFPKSLRLRQGTMGIVEKDGMRMLKASDRSEFLINLPEVLPTDFTIEFDLVPKECCAPQDVSFEGTPAINQGEASAHVMWNRESIQVVGGAVNNTIDTKMPAELAATLPGMLTEIRVSMDGASLKLLTNGQEVLNTNRKFARTRVLRIFLGGQNDREQAVYLARLRVATNSPPPPPRP